MNTFASQHVFGRNVFVQFFNVDVVRSLIR